MNLVYALGRGVINLMTFLANNLPRRLVLGMGAGFGSLVRCLVPRHRRIAMDNLRQAFKGEKDERELKSILRGVYRHWGRTGMETVRLKGVTKRGLDAPVSVEGLEHLEKACRGGRGAVLALAHIGCFTVTGCKLTAEGYKFTWVIRMARDKNLQGWLEALLRGAGVGWVFDGDRIEAVRRSVAVLRGGGILGLMVDQNTGGGIFVDYFGRKAATAIGAATLARRCGVELVPAFIRWQDGARHHLVIEAPLKTDAEDNDSAVADLTAKVTARAEKWVRSYPEQWLWLHRRWKTRPPDEEAGSPKAEVEKT